MNDAQPNGWKSPAAFAAAWLVGLLAFAAIAAWLSVGEAQRQMEATGLELQRTIAQATAQHDAHLTSLATLAIASDPAPAALFEQLADSITRFYPRIVSIVLFEEQGGGLTPLAASGEALPDTARQQFLTAAPTLQRGTVSMLVDPAVPGRYQLLKRTSDPNGRFLVALAIDASRLLDTPDLPAGLSLQLTGSGITLVGGQPAPAGWAELPLAGSWLVPSPTQPLSLRLEQRLTITQVLPAIPLLLFAAATLVLVAGAYLLLQQRRIATHARQRQLAQEHQLRLEHAARVNSMGELASGIAHELTQPLTALLSQSQAGLRLANLDPPDRAALAGVLEANVRQARRAADILGRLRAYVSKSPTQPQPTDLNRIATEVAALLGADLRDKGIALQVVRSAAAATVLADPIELEQVLHNLVRNAADAIEGAGRSGQVLIELTTDATHARVRISDDGPGIPADVLPHLFEPFYSTKPSGMGLGLPLCETLVERFGGSIEAANNPDGGASFTVLLPLRAES